MTTFTVRWSTRLLLLAASTAGAGDADAAREIDMNRFACAVYAQLATQDDNLFFSPYSLATALAMTAEGARGETAREMGETMKLPATLQRDDATRPWDFGPLHAQLRGLAARLAPRTPAPHTVERIDSLQRELAQANAALESARSYDATYTQLSEKASRIADELNALLGQIDPTEFRSANALWVERSFAIDDAYLDAIARDYRSGGARPVDFAGNPETARAAINTWVADRTRDRIPELLARGNVDTSTRLVLTNAVYFLGEWLEPFDTRRTQVQPFAQRDGRRVEVPLMRAFKRDGVRYAAFNADGSVFATPRRVNARDEDTSGRYPDDGFQLVELPYRGGALAMQLLLPMRADGVAALEARLDADFVQRADAALEARAVDVALPRFRLDARAEFSRALQQLGMRRAFVNPARPDGAQFDGISAAEDPNRRLYIGAVVHQAFVQVDEKGTEAAAATAVAMLAGAALPEMVDFNPVFRADRPFVFLIRDTRSGAVLFLGRLLKPDPA